MKAMLSCNFILAVWARFEKQQKVLQLFFNWSLLNTITLLSFLFHQKNEWWVGTKQKHSVCVQFTLCFDKQRPVQGKFLRDSLFRLNLLTTILNVNRKKILEVCCDIPKEM